MHPEGKCNAETCAVCGGASDFDPRQQALAEPTEADALAFAQQVARTGEVDTVIDTPLGATRATVQTTPAERRGWMPARAHSNGKPWGITDPVLGKFLVSRPVRRAAEDVAVAARKSGILKKDVFITALMQTLDQPVETLIEVKLPLRRAILQYMKVAEKAGLSRAQSLVVLAKPEL